jgi:hypothetical protein
VFLHAASRLTEYRTLIQLSRGCSHQAELILEKMNAFAEKSKVDIALPTAQVVPDYEAKRIDARLR